MMGMVELMSARNKIYCLIGPSGTGKDRIKNSINLPHIISYRTRKIREGEVEGVDGYFISEKLFKEMHEEDQWIASTYYAGNYYGITQAELFELEESPMIYVIDWEGVVKLKEGLSRIEGYSPYDVVTIFIDSDREEVYKRMVAQGRSSDEVAVRMQRYDEDLKPREYCDYVVNNYNNQLERTVNKIYEIILYNQNIGMEVGNVL